MSASPDRDARDNKSKSRSRSRSRSRSPSKSPRREESRGRSESRGRDRRSRSRSRSNGGRGGRDGGRGGDSSGGSVDQCKIFIGNLSFQTAERDLRSDFEKFGEIKDVYIPTDRMSGRPRGFGFVTFNDTRDAEDAVKDMDGRDIDGRAVTVNIAKARGPIGSGGGGGGFQSRGGYGNDRYGGGGGYGDRGGYGRDRGYGGRRSRSRSRSRGRRGRSNSRDRDYDRGYGGGGRTSNADGKADPEIDDMVADRARARRDREFEKADRIRDDLRRMGVEVDDSTRDTTWYRR